MRTETYTWEDIRYYVVAQVSDYVMDFKAYNFLSWSDAKGNQGIEFERKGDTAPHAICLAALKAVGYEFSSK